MRTPTGITLTTPLRVRDPEADLLAIYRELVDFDQTALLEAARALAADEGATRRAYGRYLAANEIPPAHLRGAEAKRRWQEVRLAEQRQAILDILSRATPIPTEIRAALRFHFELLCAGIPSELLKPTLRIGGRKSPLKEKAEAFAVEYLRRVAAGSIKDSKHNHTAARFYGVSDDTPPNWLKALQDEPTGLEGLADKDLLKSMKGLGRWYRSL